MLTVGLTGGIGSGKSQVSDLFHTLFSTPIIDADVIAKQLTQTPEVLEKISSQIGAEFVDENNRLKRKKLRQAIFSSPDTRAKLEKILHPLVYDEIREELNTLDTPYCIVVIPLLLETKQYEFLDRILVVDCTVENQVARVMQRDQCSESHVKRIIASQASREDRLKLANDIIENNDSIELVKEKVINLNHMYTQLGNKE